MPIEVCTVGGFSECGRNCTAIKVDDEVVILDMGLNMEEYINHTQTHYDDIRKHDYKDLLSVNAVPNFNHIKDWKKKVVAIVPSHGHLDHIGAIPFSAGLFPKASIIGTPYTIEVLRSILKDEKINLSNNLIAQNPNSKYKLSNNITIEFVYITHSIPQATIVAIHTPYGKVVYANDFKLDHSPTLGQKPNLKRLKEISTEGVDLLICESLYANVNGKCPSEAIAQQMLRDVISHTDCTGKGVIMTTFASQIARLRSMIDLGKKMNRRIVLFGRSLNKYIRAAETVQIVNFTKDVNIYSRRKDLEKVMRRINKEGIDKYLIICTGHQGEEKAVLARIIRGELPLKIRPGDLAIFSCSVIPVETNKENRRKLEQLMKDKGLRLFVDIHSSGHGHREDYREMIEMLKPKQIIPSHAGEDLSKHLVELAVSMGYVENKTIHLMADGKRLTLK
ncbi:MAG: MBL fold metallo-hydrolase RNA specificity domain-containing protein [archaeon]|nr:MBL fold metallo-hydrolase [Nanoarchaeota archaeon]